MVFLSESNVRLALQRAGALPLQRTFHEAAPPHSSPALVERRFLPPGRETGSGEYQTMGSHSSLGSYGPPVLTQFSRSPTQISREPTPPNVPERFVPGKETESVLKITKRPKLRPKDLSHRQSLDGGVPIPPSFEELGIVSPAPFFTPGYPPRYQPREVRPSTSEWERPLMVTLLVGRQQLVFHGSIGMPVDELRRSAGDLMRLDPSTF